MTVDGLFDDPRQRLYLTVTEHRTSSAHEFQKKILVFRGVALPVETA